MPRNTGRVLNNYDGLIAGQVAEPVSILVAASQTISRGDLLELVVTESVSGANITRTYATAFSKPSAAADIKNIYVIAATDITTGSSDTTMKIPAYRDGNFNANKVVLGGSSTLADNYNVLLAKGIVLKSEQSGLVTA